MYLLHVYHDLVRMFERYLPGVDKFSNGCYKSNIAAKSNIWTHVVFESVGTARYSRSHNRKDIAMTISLNHSVAGHRTRPATTAVVPAAAVWEPSGYREASGEQRAVRTLRVDDRTQRRETSPPRSTWQDRARRRRETAVTYLVGAVFGFCVVGATMLAGGDEPAAPATDPTVSQATVSAR